MRRCIALLCFVGIIVSLVFYIFDIRVMAKRIQPQAIAKTIAPTPTPEASPVLEKAMPQSGTQWALVWEDGFEAPLLDLNVWTAVERKNNYNNELQAYTPFNCKIQDGCLHLIAKRETLDGKAYTSGMVKTQGKFEFVYGKIEARIKVPTGVGIFPAFWLLTDSGNYEIDIMEMIGNDPGLFYGVRHYWIRDKLFSAYKTISNQKLDEFHVFSVEWSAGSIRWFMDGRQFFSVDKGIPSQNMHILFSLAVGGNWPGDPDEKTVFPCSFVIDYVKLYRHA